MKYGFDLENGYVLGSKSQRIGVLCKNGYVDIRRGGKYVGKAHRMLWEHAHGEIPYGMEINHKNGNKSDNRLINLELVTRSENAIHAYKIGLCSASGVSNGRSILNDNSVAKIRSMRGSMSYKLIGKLFGVSATTIYQIMNHHRWRHVGL